MFARYRKICCPGTSCNTSPPLVRTLHERRAFPLCRPNTVHRNKMLYRRARSICSDRTRTLQRELTPPRLRTGQADSRQPIFTFHYNRATDFVSTLSLSRLIKLDEFRRYCGMFDVASIFEFFQRPTLEDTILSFFVL